MTDKLKNEYNKVYHEHIESILKEFYSLVCEAYIKRKKFKMDMRWRDCEFIEPFIKNIYNEWYKIWKLAWKLNVD